ncbi:MAG: hypothetical protein ISP84_06670 [Candidatus Poseidonia sp.]|nr:hypothetical protein [Poseidonia sp.]
MATPMSPRNMLLVGIVLVLLNVAALAPLATGAVEGAVEETFATFTKDNACADDDCTAAEDDWAVSTSSRDFYGWSITNVDDVMATGAAPTYEKVGPVTYDITTTKTITGYDAATGELTYNSVKSFACAADSAVPCDTDVTQLNIAFQTQVIGATGMAIGGIMDMTKAAFTAGMLAQDLESLWPGVASAAAMSGSYSDTVAAMASMGGNETMAANAIGDSFYDGWDAYFAANNLSGLNNVTPYPESVTYSMAMSTTASFDNLTYAFNSAVMPGLGTDVSLLSDVGTMVFAGHCDAYPTDTTDVTNSSMRAGIWGYTGSDNATTTANDWAMCFGIGGNFATNFGGADDMWMMDTTGTSVNASTRLAYGGITMDNMAAMAMLFGDGDDVITGLLETNDDGTEYGVANFLSMDAATAMATYGMDATTYGAVAMWAGGWFTDATSLPMILLGGSGEMTASLFVNTSFGAEDPLNGGYLDNSLNLGGAWAMLGASGGEAVNLDPAISGNALYGPLGLTTSSGSAIFLYGELSGMTPPIDFTTMGPGAPMAWNESTIAALYGVDTNAAAAMRALMMGPIYGTTSASFVPGYLMSNFGTTPYLTQSFNNWLLGWHDPVNAYLATGNPMDMSVGWMSLETNETYYGSNGVANGDGTSYTICTGEAGDCDQGETLAEDGSTQLSWRNDAMMAATFGLIMPESLVGTTGGFLTGDGDKVDVSGYAIADVTCDGTDEVKGIPVDVCTATVTATERNIQANLLETYSLLDATPGALPVYFGSDITMKAEEISGLIIAGDSTSTFYLDTRAHGSQASAPTMADLTPVFEIQSTSTIADDDAEVMESSIVQNQDKMTYWTNFDSWIDWVTLLFWLGGIAMIAMGMIGAANAPTESDSLATAAAEEEAKADEAPEEEAEEADDSADDDTE